MFRCFLAATVFVQTLAFTAWAAEIKTLAGTGEKGFSGDGGPAIAAQFNEPSGVTLGPDGAVYVCDTNNHRIRRIDADGIVTTVAGNGTRGFSGDGGPATEAALADPYDLRFDADGILYIVDQVNQDVRSINPKTGIISTISGIGGTGGFSGDGGPAAAAHLKSPYCITIDSRGNLFIGDLGNRRIREIAKDTGIITTFAGSGAKGAPADGTAFAEAPLNGPRAIDLDAAGNLWVAMREGNAVFDLEAATGQIQHKAGNGKVGFTGNDGPALEAALSSPKGLCVGPDGSVYIADTESHSIRKIDPQSGTITVVAGTGTRGDGPDGDPLKCQMSRPHGIFAESDGTLLIGDTETHRIRILHP